MKVWLPILTAFCLFPPSISLWAAPPAFPGAEGFGAAASGGRGGRVVFVTNTQPDGLGSLQWALDQPSPKYVLFRTSGVIDARIHLRRGDVTIAGQTSPGGITVRGFVTDETPFQDQEVRAPGQHAENWILRHIRIRPGADGPSDDGLRLRYTRRAIVDHVSVGNATDEAVEISYANGVTIQNCILAETIGSHAFYGGMLMNYSNPGHGFALDRISVHHNAFVRLQGRLPEVSRESLAAAGSTMRLEISCNLYWDPSFFIALGADTNVVTDRNGNPYPLHFRLNAVNNVFRPRIRFPFGMWDDAILRAPESAARNYLHVRGNRLMTEATRRDYALFHCCNDFRTTGTENSARLATALPRRHAFPRISYTPASALRSRLVARAGAFPRDPMDRRLMESVHRDRIAAARTDLNPSGDALETAYLGAPPAPPTDRDNDGMPDGWEQSRGLDPSVPDHNGLVLSAAGYTNLEVYLAEIGEQRVAE